MNPKILLIAPVCCRPSEMSYIMMTDRRARSRADLGFYVGIIVWPLTHSFGRIHVHALWNKIRSPTTCAGVLAAASCCSPASLAEPFADACDSCCFAGARSV